MSFKFNNEEVAKKFIPVDSEVDFKIRVPQSNWPKNGEMGLFSDITPEVAEQLIKEGYNRIKKK
jgi:hypothetical protein